MLWIIFVVIAIILLLILIGILIFGKRKREVSEVFGGDPNDKQKEEDKLIDKLFLLIFGKLKPTVICKETISGNNVVYKSYKLTNEYEDKIKNGFIEGMKKTNYNEHMWISGIGAQTLIKIFKWNENKIKQIPTLEEMLEIK